MNDDELLKLIRQSGPKFPGRERVDALAVAAGKEVASQKTSRANVLTYLLPFAISAACVFMLVSHFGSRSREKTGQSQRTRPAVAVEYSLFKPLATCEYIGAKNGKGRLAMVGGKGRRELELVPGQNLFDHQIVEVKDSYVVFRNEKGGSLVLYFKPEANPDSGLEGGR